MHTQYNAHAYIHTRMRRMSQQKLSILFFCF